MICLGTLKILEKRIWCLYCPIDIFQLVENEYLAPKYKYILKNMKFYFRVYTPNRLLGKSGAFGFFKRGPKPSFFMV